MDDDDRMVSALIEANEALRSVLGSVVLDDKRNDKLRRQVKRAFLVSEHALKNFDNQQGHA